MCVLLASLHNIVCYVLSRLGREARRLSCGQIHKYAGGMKVTHGEAQVNKKTYASLIPERMDFTW
jgi:hypothetical protein